MGSAGLSKSVKKGDDWGGYMAYRGYMVQKIFQVHLTLPSQGGGGGVGKEKGFKVPHGASGFKVLGFWGLGF